MRIPVRSSCAALVLSSASGLAETRTFDLPAFDEIDVSAGISAEIVVGGAQSVRVEAASDGDFDKFEVIVRNGKLSIGLDRGFFESLSDWFDDDRDITATVTVPELSELGGNAGADVRATGMSGPYLTIAASSGARITLEELSGEDVSVDASSGGAVDASGTCGRLDANASSGGDLDLGRLECERVRVDASSGGRASVFASVSIDANASSGGGVSVAGGPDDVDIDASIGGRVELTK